VICEEAGKLEAQPDAGRRAVVIILAPGTGVATPAQR
jgi:hypothetical protein